MIADGAAASLALVAAVLSLRFDAVTARMLSFESTTFLRLAADVLGGRLLVALAGAALGAAFRTLEFLHGVRRSSAVARVLAQIETALVAVLALVAGPAAIVWLVLRAAWLYRRAARAMGLL